MDRIKPPKDYTRLKSEVVSRFLHFWSSKGGVCLCLIISFLPFFTLHVKQEEMLNYSVYWFTFLIFLIAIPHVIFRFIFHYRDVPKGWTLEQAQAWWKMEEENKHVKGVSRHDWKKIGKVLAFVVGYVVLLNLILVLVTVFDKSGIGIFAFIISAIIAPFVYLKIYRPDVLQNNASSIFNSLMEAKYGIHYKKWMLAFIGVGLGIIPMMMFTGLVGVIFCVGLLFLIAIKARFEWKVRVRL